MILIWPPLNQTNLINSSKITNNFNHLNHFSSNNSNSRLHLLNMNNNIKNNNNHNNSNNSNKNSLKNRFFSHHNSQLYKIIKSLRKNKVEIKNLQIM